MHEDTRPCPEPIPISRIPEAVAVASCVSLKLDGERSGNFERLGLDLGRVVWEGHKPTQSEARFCLAVLQQKVARRLGESDL